jgi:predicted ArsR family transcriptional regulator
MSGERQVQDPVGAVALLGDAKRRRLYDLVADSDAPVGRDDAATAIGISRELAAFHLDRLVTAGLLEAEYRRRGERRGPGAGRPAKLYRRFQGEVAVSLPQRDYATVARLFGDALRRSDGDTGARALDEVARAQGQVVGTEARREAGPRPSHRRLTSALMRVLRRAGYEPRTDEVSGDVQLRNCPYQALATSHRELTCAMNAAWAQGVAKGLGDPQLDAELSPVPDRCCVVFHGADGRAASG